MRQTPSSPYPSQPPPSHPPNHQHQTIDSNSVPRTQEIPRRSGKTVVLAGQDKAAGCRRSEKVIFFSVVLFLVSTLSSSAVRFGDDRIVAFLLSVGVRAGSACCAWAGRMCFVSVRMISVREVNPVCRKQDVFMYVEEVPGSHASTYTCARPCAMYTHTQTRTHLSLIHI